MNFSMLLLVCVLCGQAMPEHETLVKGLMSGDRSVRKATVQRLERLSKKDLIAVAQNAVDNEEMRKAGVIYAFHRILAVAQKKGLQFDEVMALLEAPGSSTFFRMAILDWVFETGAKGISPEDSVTRVEKFGRLFADRQESAEIRLAAHRIARELATVVQQELKNTQKAGTDEAWQRKAAEAIREHIRRVCAIVADTAESDSVVESFAGYIPYYRIYIEDGLVEERTLKASLELALHDKKRTDKCRKNLQAILSQF